MPKVFISYRRVDAGYVAHQVSEALKKRLGEQSVFIDIVEIEHGAEFPQVIAQALAEADILVPIIGSRWLDASFVSGPMRGQRRLDDANDFVRREIASALSRDIPILPVVIEGVSLASIASELPEEIAGLARKNEIQFRAGHDLEADLKRLIQTVRSILLPPLRSSDLELPKGIAVVPQGLRSFGPHERTFFRYLLPDLDPSTGLPRQLGFWKSRIEATKLEHTFRVGLIYGPSGCGKSSMVKAGLLPMLPSNVHTVYVEARPQNTEAEIVGGIHRCLPHLAGTSDLRSCLEAAKNLAYGEKLLIVLDQFEQYLHSTPDEDQRDLAISLQACDGDKVQCIVMIRDDFLTPITRFMKRVSIPISSGENMAIVDLFDKRHAKKVLALLGQGYGGLPILANGESFTKDQNAFLNQAVSEMADGDYVIPVRLALFAQMFRGRAWSTSILLAVGGTIGVGATFLEESLSAASAPEKQRRHQKAAQRALALLLPEPGTTIKGAMRTRSELLRVSGYEKQPHEFDQLLQVLDNDLRLVTPADTVARSERLATPSENLQEQRYQLTHDYLVPALREWLARKQKETAVGRAELLLSEQATTWTLRPENRQLPSLAQWFRIRCLTNRNDWTLEESKMMKRAGRFHTMQCGFVLGILSLVSLSGIWIRHRIVEQEQKTYASSLLQRLFDAETARVPAIIDEMSPYRRWLDPLLQEASRMTTEGTQKHLHVSLALLPIDTSQAASLIQSMLHSDPSTLVVIRDCLEKHHFDLPEDFWQLLDDSDPVHAREALAAATALSKFSPDDVRWDRVSERVAHLLAHESPFYVKEWMTALKPAASHLVRPLSKMFHEPSLDPSRRLTIANILADFASEESQVLAELLMVAEVDQFSVIYPKLVPYKESSMPILENELGKVPLEDWPFSHPARENLAKRQANAAIALFKLGYPEKVWPLLNHQSDPRLRSYLIHRLGPLHVDFREIVKRLSEPTREVAQRRALLLSIGEFSPPDLPLSERDTIISTVKDIFRDDPDPGLHAAAEWLLRSWGQDGWIAQVTQKLASQYEVFRPRVSDSTTFTDISRQPPPYWYINSQEQSMIVVPGPVEFVMGSPETESDRKTDEIQQRMRINRTFAISSHLVTKEQFLRFRRDFDNKEMHRFPDPSSPIAGMTWHEAAEYCNWLSRQEGIDETQLCYQIEDGHVIKLKDNYLRLTSYRLPTEAEIEYVTRAGSATSRFYGETDELLVHYAWYIANSKDMPHRVGTKKPNDLGIFDAHGNLWTWCQNGLQASQRRTSPKTLDDLEEDVLAQTTRGLRGGSYIALPSSLRSATCNQIEPSSRFIRYGIRIARTIAAPETTKTASKYMP